MSLDDFRTLGRSGLVVSPLALGTMTFGTQRWGSADEVSRDIFQAYVDAGGNFDLRSAVQQVRSELPDGILEPQIFRADTTSRDLASFAAESTDMTVEQLSWYVDNTVSKELLSIPAWPRCSATAVSIARSA